MTDNKQNARKQAQRRARQRKQRNRRIALTACLMIAVMVASIGGTLAWLTDQTGPVTNTFTVGDINIDLYETETDESTQHVTERGNLKIVPNNDIFKNPTVEVEANSEACWLFVKVEEENWPDYTISTDSNSKRKVDYSIADGWSILTTNADGTTKVYYRAVNATTDDVTFKVLANDKVTVSNTLTKNELNQIGSGDNAPKLIFYAYAVQSDTLTVHEAWKQIDSSYAIPPITP